MTLVVEGVPEYRKLLLEVARYCVVGNPVPPLAMAAVYPSVPAGVLVL